MSTSLQRSAIADCAFNAIVLLFATSTVAQPFVDKLAYAPHGPTAAHFLPYEEIHHGDIIVFRWPVDISQNYVKRVIGLPGDRIRIVDKQVFRNGVRLTELYVQHIDPNRVPGRDDVDEFVVPPDHYFAMGDNRDNSSHSRYWGYVPRENIVGKPVLVYWSFDANTEDLTSYSSHTSWTSPLISSAKL